MTCRRADFIENTPLVSKRRQLRASCPFACQLLWAAGPDSHFMLLCKANPDPTCGFLLGDTWLGKEQEQGCIACRQAVSPVVEATPVKQA